MLIPALSPVPTPSEPNPTPGLPGALIDHTLGKVKEMGDTLHKTDSVFDIPFHAYKIAEELKKLPEGLLDTALNHVAAALPQPWLPAATIGSNHLGIPHLHTIPPNCIPSFGPLEIGGCASVLIYGQRAARLGDIGKATCNPIAPFLCGHHRLELGVHRRRQSGPNPGRHETLRHRGPETRPTGEERQIRRTQGSRRIQEERPSKRSPRRSSAWASESTSATRTRANHCSPACAR
jgi:hypothetical protein